MGRKKLDSDRTKTKFYNNKITINFHGKAIKEGI